MNTAVNQRLTAKLAEIYLFKRTQKPIQPFKGLLGTSVEGVILTSQIGLKALLSLASFSWFVNIKTAKVLKTAAD